VGQSQAIIQLIGNVLIFWAALVGTASVIVHARVPWWRSEMGVHLFVYMIGIALVLDLSCIKILLGDSWWFTLLRLIAFIIIPVAMSQRLWLQIKAQRGVRDAAARRPPPADA
jgi:hypothetical protein